MDEFIKIYEDLKNKKKDISYVDIYSAIKEYKEKNKEEIKELDYEFLAFSLYGYDHGGTNPWGTFYGPMATRANGDGTYTESPGKSFIKEEVIKYWENRATNEKDDFLKSRYADLVRDLKEICLGQKPNYKNTQIIIDSIINTINKGFYKDINGKFALKRALNIATSTNNFDGIEILKQTIINFEDKIAVDDMAGLRGFSYDYLINKKNIILSTEEENKIINDLESRLTRVKDPYLVSHCTDRLTEYYKKNKDYENILRLLKLLETSYKENDHSNSDGLLKANYYQELIKLYSNYQEDERIKKERDRLLVEYKSISKETLESFQEFSTSFEITKEQLEEYINSFFVEGLDIKGIIKKIVIHFVSKIKQSKEQLNDLAKNHPILFLVKRQLYDNNGMPIYTFGNIEQDYDSHWYSLISQNLQISKPLIDLIINKFFSIFKSNELLKELYESPVFLEEDKEYIKRLLNNYYSKNYLEFNCMTIPLIEKCFRELIAINGGITSTLENTENGSSFKIRPLDSLLRDPIMKETYLEDFIVYFRILLTLPIGRNLRNDLAHGININYFSSKSISDRLIHILMCLSLIRLTEINANL